MKIFATAFSIILLLMALDVRADAPVSVPPDEMAYICGSLGNYVQMAIQARQSGIPLETAIAAVKGSMQRNLTMFQPEKLARYQDVVGDLFTRVYASQDASMTTANVEITSACRTYAPTQYSEEDVRNLGACAMKASPYPGYAKVRDTGMSLDDQMKWLKQHIDSMNQYSADQKSQLYSDLSGKMRYVYDHRDMSGDAIYAQKLTACFDDSKRASNAAH